MERTTTLGVDDDGGPVVRHVAPPGAAADALRHEVEALRLASGLGVVALVEAADRPDGGAAMATRYVAGGTLTDVARDGGDRVVVAVLAGVARVLADLHDAGIVHGRLTADHVLGVGDDVALCGLSGARLPGGTGPADPTVDTEAFAALVDATCADDTELCARARRAVSGLVPSPPTTNLRVVAAALAAIAGPASVGAEPEAPRIVRPRRERRASSSLLSRLPHRSASTAVGALAAVVVAVAVVAGVGALRSDPSGRSAGPGPVTAAKPLDRPEPTTTAPAPQRELPAPPPVRVWPDPEPPAGARPGSQEAAVVAHEGVEYEVGAPGDLVLVGDWDCDGVETAGVVRPVDGSVWTFARWAPGDEVVEATPHGAVPSAVAAEVVREEGSCDAITVATGDGRQVLVRLG